MNVIFCDFDGTLDTVYYKTDEQIQSKIKILAEIAKEYDCKVVIEAAAKAALDPDTLEVEEDTFSWVTKMMKWFKEAGVEVVGRTPECGRWYSEYSRIGMWKEDEIRLYLFRHPEIDHFCILDDDDLQPHNSDLNTLREYLVTTAMYNRENPEEEGLLPRHKEEVGKVLKLENKYQKFAKKRAERL